MKEYRLADMEKRFAELIWAKEPIPSGELVKLCEEELNWKKSTTYTMLKRLCKKSIFQNQNGIVTSLVGKDEFAGLQGRQFIENTFGGSLPKFLAAFTSVDKLSKSDIDQIQELIDRYKEKKDG